MLTFQNKLNLNIILPKGYGEHLGISDDEFINQGAEIVNDKEKILAEKAALTTAKFMWNFLSGLAIKHKLPLQTAA